MTGRHEEASIEQSLNGRVHGAGAGAMIFAVYWMLGACLIGTAGGVVMELFEHPSTERNITIFVQMGVILAWLGFVVYRATKGGRFQLHGNTLRYRRFILATTRELAPNPTHAAMVTYSQGDAYINGPALVFQTDRGEISIATMDSKLGERLGILPNDQQIVAPTLVVDPAEFERLASRE